MALAPDEQPKEYLHDAVEDLPWSFLATLSDGRNDPADSPHKEEYGDQEE